MKAFNVISGVVLLGVFSCISAQFGPLKYQHVQSKESQGPLNITVGQQKQLVGKVVSTVADTVADIVGENGNKNKEKASPTTSLRSPQPVPTETFGVAKIVDKNEGVICSGIHLKPWIILSTAECLYPRKAQDVYVDVTLRSPKTGKGMKISSQVADVVYHPRYRPGVPHNDLVLVLNYGAIHWDVDEFKLSRIPYTTEELIRNKIKTYTYKWRVTRAKEMYIPEVVYGKVTTNFTICGEVGSPKNYFCVIKPSTRSINKADLGDPLFFTVGNMKRCIGLYSGRNKNRNLAGHVYESILPSISWIEEYVFEHPVPPFYY